MDINEKKSLQFELWHQCNQKCVFCYNANSNTFTPTELKIKALDDAYDFLSDNKKMIPYNTVSYIGGEFFQGQLDTDEVKNKFFRLIQKTAELQISGKIREVWIMCTLTIGSQKDLYTSLDIMKKIYIQAGKPELMNQVWLVTSYDTIGRFHLPKMQENWSNNMLNLHEKYPTLNFNTCTILTQDIITKYLNGEFSFNDFMNKYHTSMFFKQPSPGGIKPIHENLSKIEQYMEAKQLMEKRLPGFFPKREDFLKFLIKFKEDCPGLYDKLFNIIYRADDLYRNFNESDDNHRMQLNHRNKHTRNELNEKEGNCLEFLTAKCGHQLNYCAYIDSDECVICDREFIQNQF